MDIAITGATGFLGSALAARLAGDLHNVFAFTRRASAPSQDNVQIINAGNLSLDADWREAVAGIEAVVHCAARVHVMQDTAADLLAAFREVNVNGTMNLARQAATAGVKRFVFISSVKVNGEATQPGCPFTEADSPNPQDAYGQSKHEAEQSLRKLSADSGMEVVIIRPPLVYGPGVKANFASLMRAVKRGWPLPFGAVHNQRSFVAIDNLVDFIVTCISHPLAANQTFLVSDGHDLSTTDLVRRMALAAGVSLRLIPVPSWAVRAGGTLIGRRDAVQRLYGNLQIDISKSQTLLGWRPSVSIEEGMRRAMSA